MAEKTLNTRISLKYGQIGNWTDSFKPLKGEVCFAEVSTKRVGDDGNIIDVPAVVFKVGDGTKTFGELPWVSALAADVHNWAKMTQEDFEAYLSGFIADEIQDTNDNTTYSFAIPTEGDDKGKLVITETPHVLGVAGTPVVTKLDFIAPDELTTILGDYYTKEEVDGLLEALPFGDYYTKDEVDALVDGKLHTEDEIKGIASAEIGRLIDASGDDEVLKSIGDLVDYVEKNAGDITQLVTDVGTANTNASNAVTTAGEAKGIAEDALEVANGAAADAEAALEAATNAQTGAAASAEAAAESARLAGEAKTAAETAKQGAVDAQGLAEGARDAAVTAKGAAETAQGKAEEAQGLAVEAKEAAVVAQGKAEAAQAAAEQAKADAVASNTSATAIANEAKTTAEGAATVAGEAKTAAEKATADVAGLATIAKTGNVNDLVQTAGDVLIFDCGGAE